MSDTETCKERIFDTGRSFGSWPCGRKVKEDGLCGIHLGAKRRREQKSLEQDEKDRADAKVKAEVREYLNTYGLATDEAWPEYAAYPASRHTGRVVITLDALKRILGDGGAS